MSNIVDDFNTYRAKMNDKILADNNKIIKRIFIDVLSDRLGDEH